jgi:hypothetical protein
MENYKNTARLIRGAPTLWYLLAGISIKNAPRSVVTSSESIGGEMTRR